ncbi:RpiB/LacA/LacB family sugar-phosphate isomerase [Patescibacteria group bacterium]
MKIYIGADHAGFRLKKQLIEYIETKKISVEDVGNFTLEPADDYPDYAKKVAANISGKETRGILICNSGVGVNIVANKFKGVRAVNAFSPAVAKSSRRDDDTNVLSLGAEHITFVEAKKILDTWLKTPFSKAQRHKRRVNKIKRLET